MYHALYRKWRPKVFADVIGQEAVVQTLKNQVKSDKISHAYLFTGPKGTGKTSCAKILAKAANCPNTVDGSPCNSCKICKGIDDGSVMDILEIDAASNNGVDNIRELREEANFTPSVARYRVYIIDEAHMLSIGAFNALLKILEEPPSYVIFILATTESHKIPATILSRCQRFDFRKISSADISKRLLNIAQAEQIKLQEEAALFIANLADGAMRDALSILDSCASFSNSDVTIEIVQSVAGVSNTDCINRLVNNIKEKNLQGTFKILDEVNNQSTDPLRFCQQLITHFRNLIIIKGTGKADHLISVLPSELEKLKDQAKEFTMDELLCMLSEFSVCSNTITKSSSKKLELEICLVKIVSRETLSRQTESTNKGQNVDDKVINSLMDRLSALESKVASYSALVDNDQNIKRNANGMDKLLGSRQTLAQVDYAKEYNQNKLYESIEELTCWSEILDRLFKINPALAAALDGSNGYVNELAEIILIDAKSELFLDIIRNSEQAKQTLKKAIHQQLGKKYRIGPYNKGNGIENGSNTNNILEEIEKAALDAGITPKIVDR